MRDRQRGVYVDHTKVHTIDFEGRFYRSRGPLNTIRSPQGRPVLAQAGASPKGRDFAAKYADVIVCGATPRARLSLIARPARPPSAPARAMAAAPRSRHACRRIG